MAAANLRMRKPRQNLRQKWSLGMSHRPVARSPGVERGDGVGDAHPGCGGRIRQLGGGAGGRRGGLGESNANGLHREGRRPGNAVLGQSEIAEDLRILARHWRWICVYGSAELGETILRTIQEERLDLNVLPGAWLAPEESLPDSAGAGHRFPALRAQNHRKIDAAVRLRMRIPASCRRCASAMRPRCSGPIIAAHQAF